VWSGPFARTAPGWSLLVRSPANLPRSKGYELYEGIIETDRWFGPLFTVLRLTRTDVPVEFDASFPFLQVQPVHRDTYGDSLDAYEVIGNLKDLEAQDWEDTFGPPLPRPTSTRTPSVAGMLLQCAVGESNPGDPRDRSVCIVKNN
jgi:hypothetical protein